MNNNITDVQVATDNKTVTIEVEIDDEVMTLLSRAVSVGIQIGFRNHQRRLDQRIMNEVIGEATSAAIHSLFRDRQIAAAEAVSEAD